MSHKRRRLKRRWVDPAVLKWRAAKRGYDRESRSAIEVGLARSWVLLKVAGVALLAMVEALVARPGERRGVSGYRRVGRYDVVGLAVLALLAVGVARAWLVGVAAGVAVVCVGGSVYVVRRMRRRLGELEGELGAARGEKAGAVGVRAVREEKDAARRREGSAR